MKKSLICMTAVVAMMFATVTSYASGSYEIGKNSASFDAAEGKSTVLIYKGGTDIEPTSDNIVYVSQASGAFSASTSFMLKANPDDGLYTVRFGDSDGTTATTSFYIGTIDTANDVKLTMIAGAGGYNEVDGKYNIGYTVDDLDLSKGYKSIIIQKSDDTYMGCTIPITLSGKGTLKVGIQINGVAGTLEGETLTPEIKGVWLSTRGIETAPAADEN